MSCAPIARPSGACGACCAYGACACGNCRAMEAAVRVLFTPYPSIPHLLPYVSLAWAFQSAGHEVRIASQHAIADAVTAYGLTPVSLGDPSENEARARDNAPGPKDPDVVLRYADLLGLSAEEREYWIEWYQYLLVPIADYARPDLAVVTQLMELARSWRPDLVLWDATFAPGRWRRGCAARHTLACCLAETASRGASTGSPHTGASCERPGYQRTHSPTCCVRWLGGTASRSTGSCWLGNGRSTRCRSGTARRPTSRTSGCDTCRTTVVRFSRRGCTSARSVLGWRCRWAPPPAGSSPATGTAHPASWRRWRVWTWRWSPP